MGMFCPRCRVMLDEMTSAGVVIDVCSACRGMWLDRGELEQIVARSDSLHNERRRAGPGTGTNVGLEKRRERPTARPGDEGLLRCPRCYHLLRETWQDGVPVDMCSRCRGVWLDNGELGRIKAYLRDVRYDWERDEREPGELIRWARLPRYPRRHPRRRLGRLGIYS